MSFLSNCRRSGTWRFCRLATMLLLCCPPRSLAENPKMGFDVPATVYCQDVTPAELKKLNPYERLVEAKIPAP